MNASKAIEQAMVAVLRQFASMGDVELRAWQALPESSVGSSCERKFPCVDVRAAPPSVDENGLTCQSAVTILCATKVDDDKNHATVSAIYEAVQGVCDNLYAEALHGTVGVDDTGAVPNEIGVFDASLLNNEAEIERGGFTFNDGIGPQQEEGLNVIGINFIIHYSREF